MISDTPGRGGRGVKKGQIFADVLYGWPLTYCNNIALHFTHVTRVKHEFTSLHVSMLLLFDKKQGFLLRGVRAIL